MIWQDVPIYIRDYSNGIKKLDSVSDKLQNEKLKYNSNAFNLSPLSDDFGLDEKYTIRPFNIHTSSSLKDLFKNKTTPSRTLGGTVNLSNGTKEIIKMTEKMIPKIDHSKIDSGYYENKMNKIHSNEDLMLREMSKADEIPKIITKADEFAKGFVTGIKKEKTIDEVRDLRLKRFEPKETARGGGGGEYSDFEVSPPPTQSKSSRFSFKMSPSRNLKVSPLHHPDLENIYPESKEENNIEQMSKEYTQLKSPKRKVNNALQKALKEKFKENDDEKENDSAQRLQNAWKNKKAKQNIEGKKAEKQNKGRERSNSISQSVIDELEASDSDPETEKQKEDKPEAKKKGRQSKAEKEESHKDNLANLTSNMLEEGIEVIEKEIEDYKTENQKHVLQKEGTDDLNTKLKRFGLKFKTGTSVKTVLKNLNEHKKRLESEMEDGNLKGRLAGLKEGKKQMSKSKELESIEV